MKKMYLQQLTKYKNSEEGYSFTPLNAAIQYIEEEYPEKESLPFAKILLVLKHLELCEKYGFGIQPYYMKYFLSPEQCKTTLDDIYEFLENSSIYENDEMTVQNLFTEEFMEYFEDLDIRIRAEQYVKNQLYMESQEIVEEKYNYEIKSSENNESEDSYTDFRNFMINSNITIQAEKPNVIITKLQNQSDDSSKGKTYLKQQSSPADPYGE